MLYQIESQLSVVVADLPGETKRITELLSRANVAIDAMTLSEESEQHYIRILSQDPERAQTILGANGIEVVHDRVLSVQLNERKGQLASITQVFAQAQVNIDYLYTWVENSDTSTWLAMKVENIPLAIRILDEIGESIPELPAYEYA